MSPHRTDPKTTDRRLYVELEIEPTADVPCPLSDLDESINDVRLQLVEDSCHTDATLDAGSDQGEAPPGVVHTRTEIGADCPCAVFRKFDCIPQVTDVTDGRLRVDVYLPDRECLADLVDALKDVAAGVHLRRLKRIETAGDGERSPAGTMDLLEVTEKQREAAAIAVAEGYYSSHREASLADLADELDISKSALSQRLGAVESKLVTDAFAVAAPTTDNRA